MSSQQPRRSAQAPRDNQQDLVWTGIFLVAAVLGAVLSYALRPGHTISQLPAAIGIAVVVAAAFGVVLRLGLLDERPPAAGHGGNRNSGDRNSGDRNSAGRHAGGQPADASRYGGGRPPAEFRQAGGQQAAPGRRSPMTGHQGAGPQGAGHQGAGPGAKNPAEAWWTSTGPQEAAAPVTGQGFSGTVTMMDSAATGLPPRTSRPGPALQAEAVIAQCPQCGSFRMDSSSQPGMWRFTCHECRHQWSWQPGTPWPEVQVRPDHGSKRR